MPFLQSMGVRFGVQSVLENCGVDKETAGWVAAGASLVTAVATADMHGHIAGEAIAQGVHHTTGHIASQGASHAVSQGTSHAASQGSSHVVSESTNHAVSGGHDLSNLQRTGTSELDLNHAGFTKGETVYVNHEHDGDYNNWQVNHSGTIEDFRYGGPGNTEVKIKVDSTNPQHLHNGEWVSEKCISLSKTW